MKCAKFTTLGNRHSPPDASYGWVRLCQQTPAHNYLRINVVNMNLRCLSTQPPQPDRAPTAAESLVPNILRFALLLSEVAKLAPLLGGHAHAIVHTIPATTMPELAEVERLVMYCRNFCAVTTHACPAVPAAWQRNSAKARRYPSPRKVGSSRTYPPYFCQWQCGAKNKKK